MKKTSLIFEKRQAFNQKTGNLLTLEDWFETGLNNCGTCKCK
jgi:hypothetical protein